MLQAIQAILYLMGPQIIGFIFLVLGFMAAIGHPPDFMTVLTDYLPYTEGWLGIISSPFIFIARLMAPLFIFVVFMRLFIGLPARWYARRVEKRNST